MFLSHQELYSYPICGLTMISRDRLEELIEAKLQLERFRIQEAQESPPAAHEATQLVQPEYEPAPSKIGKHTDGRLAFKGARGHNHSLRKKSFIGGSKVRRSRFPQSTASASRQEAHSDRAKKPLQHGSSNELPLMADVQQPAVKHLVTVASSTKRCLELILPFTISPQDLPLLLSRTIGARLESISFARSARKKNHIYLRFFDPTHAQDYLDYLHAHPDFLPAGTKVNWTTGITMLQEAIASLFVKNHASRILRVTNIPLTMDTGEIWLIANNGENERCHLTLTVTRKGAISMDIELEFMTLANAADASQRLYRMDGLQNCGFLWAGNWVDAAIEIFKIERQRLG